MKFVLEMDQEEWQTLLELVFLGEYAVNACRPPKEISQKHRDAANALYRRHYEQTVKVSDPEAIEDNEIADIRDEVYDSVQEYLERFEEDVCLEKLAELFAEREYPPTEGDAEEQNLKRGLAEKYIRRRLQEKGLSAIRLDIPDLRRKVEEDWSRWIG